ncbi:MAG: 6-phosphofructokinase [Candidatus Margulisiibacteriota bacterium]
MKIKRIGVLTTGGDAPGMNAAIRAVVRCAKFYGLEVVGIERGYAGLIDGEMKMLDVRSVSGIINRGGTILHTVRSAEFKKKSSREKAYKHLKEHKIDGLIIIGGDGSLHGAVNIYKESKVPCIVIPATIDNDLSHTDYTIGFDTAVNTAVEAIDKIRDTANSHERVFIVEVMGREHGYLALEVGLVSGAEIVLVPEVKYKLSAVIKQLEDGHKRGKMSSIIVMAEGAGNPNIIAQNIKEETDLDVRVTILGHIQRGGTPSAFSRMLACKFGAEAVRLLIGGKNNRMVGIVGGNILSFSIETAAKEKKSINLSDYKLAQMLAI